MGGKQSSTVFDGRTRAYSSSDLPSGNGSSGERIAGLRYTNGPDGPTIRFTGGGPTSSGRSIPGSGRSGSRVLNQSLDGTDGDEEGQLPPEGHRLLIGSLPAHLSPHLLGGKGQKQKAPTTPTCLSPIKPGGASILDLPVLSQVCTDHLLSLHSCCC